MALETSDDTLKVGLDATDFERGARAIDQSAVGIAESLRDVEKSLQGLDNAHVVLQRQKEAVDRAREAWRRAEVTLNDSHDAHLKAYYAVQRLAQEQEIAERHARRRAEAEEKAAAASRKIAEASSGAAQATEKFSLSTVTLATGLGALVGTLAGGLIQGAFSKMGELFDVLGQKATKAAMDGIDSMTKLNAMLVATGNGAGFTKKQLEGLAQSIASTSRFSDEQARDAITTLLRFESVTGEVMPRAIKLSADMAAALGGDIAGAAERLGRAMESPTLGLEMLRRQGVLVPPVIREQIKAMEDAGRTNEAAILVLDALDKKFNGVAQTMQGNLRGSFNEVEKAWVDMLEAIGSSEGRVQKQITLWSALRDVLKDIEAFFAGKGSTTGNIALWMELMTGPGAVRFFQNSMFATKPVRGLTPDDGGVADADAASINEALVAQQREAIGAANAMKLYERAIGGTQTAQQKMRDEMEKILVAWKNLSPEQREAVGGTKALNEQIAEVSLKYEKKTKAVKEAGDANAHYIAYLQEQKRLEAEIARLMEYRAGWINKVKEEEVDAINARDRTLDSLEAGNASLREEIRQLGWTTEERELYNIELRRTAAINSALSDKDEAKINSLIDEQKYLVRIREELHQSVAVWDQVGDAAGGFFASLVDGSSNALEYLKRMAKDFLAEMLAIFGKKWILQIGASMMGGTTGAALAGQAQQVGQGTLTGSLGNMLSSGLQSGLGWIGSGIASAGTAIFGAGSSMTGVGLGISSAVSGGIWSSAAAGFANLASGATSTALAIGQMIPAIGVVVAGLYVLSRALQKPGGPKEEGYYYGAFSATGQGLGERPLTAGMGYGEHAPGMWRTNSAGGTAREWVEGIASAYYQTVGRLGGAAQALNFGGGIVTDPRGTAPSFVHSLLTGAGGQVIGNFRNDQVGRSPEELQAEMELQTMRMLVLALKQSDLPAEVAAVFSAVDVETADIDALREAVAAATEIADVLAGIREIELPFDLERLRQFTAGGETLTDTFNRIGGLWVQFNDLFTSDAERIAAAQGKVNETFARFGVAIPKSRDEFEALVRGIDTSTSAGRDLFEALLEIAPAFAATADAAEMARQALQSNLESLYQVRERLGIVSPGTANQYALSNIVSQFMASAAWTGGLNQQQVMNALRTISDEDFARYTPQQQQWILQILGGISDVEGAVNQVAALQQAVADAIVNSANEQLNRQIGGADALAGAGGSLMERLGLRSTVLQGAIAQTQAQQAALLAQFGPGVMGSLNWQVLVDNIRALQAELDLTGAQIGRLTVLSAQYGEAKAEELFALEQWYTEMQTVLAGNIPALEALSALFGQKWQDILDGITEGGNGAADALARAREELLAWRESLLLSSLSPLTPQQRISEAEAKYLEALKATQEGGATAEEIAAYQQAAQAFLEEARSFWGSMQEFTDIFNRIRDDSYVIGNPPTAISDPLWYEDVPKIAEGVDGTKNEVAALRAEVASLTLVVAESAKATQEAIEAAAERQARAYENVAETVR